MTLELAVDLVRVTLTQSLLLVSPIMITAILVGVTVSLLQSVTSIQEQTLTFVPKLVAVGIVLILAANWMLQSLIDFTVEFMNRIPMVAG